MSTIQFHKIWIDQCAAAENIADSFGLQDALNYLIGEKLFNFVAAAEQNELFAAELPSFVAEIREMFSNQEIRLFLADLEQNRFLAPIDPDLETDEFEEADEDDWLDDPILGAQDLLRFCRVKELLLG